MANQKLRIAFVDYVLEPNKPGRSGLSDVVWDMASELVNQGHEAHIIASYHTRTYPDPRVSVHSFPTPPMGYRNILGHCWLLKRAASIARKIQPDVIHAPEYVSTAVFALLGIRTPLVLTVPGNVFHRVRYGHSYEWYYLQVLKLAARISARKCASVIAISQEMKRWWEWTGSAPERTPCIPYGVNSARFHPVPNAREQIGLPNEPVVLLYVGRLSKEKGLLDLIDALALIKQQIKPDSIQVMLIGKGPQAEELQQRITAKQVDDIIQVRPWAAQDTLRLWYSAADAFVLPSYTEGFARVIPEAMNCGTPVIGSRITGTEDHVHEGINGFLFEPGDVQGLAEIILKAVNDRRSLQDMRATTVKYAQNELNWPCIVQRIVEDVYTPMATHHTVTALA